METRVLSQFSALQKGHQYRNAEVSIPSHDQENGWISHKKFPKQKDKSGMPSRAKRLLVELATFERKAGLTNNARRELRRSSLTE
jgi:hypothetical protein